MTNRVATKASVPSREESATVKIGLVPDASPSDRSRSEQEMSWIARRAIGRIEAPPRAAKTDREPAFCTMILSNYAGVEVASRGVNRRPVTEQKNRRLGFSRLTYIVASHGVRAFQAVVCDIPIVRAAGWACPSQVLHDDG
jgi:hypothetical protein